jgi:hypothetical protein
MTAWRRTMTLQEPEARFYRRAGAVMEPNDGGVGRAHVCRRRDSDQRIGRDRIDEITERSASHGEIGRSHAGGIRHAGRVPGLARNSDHVVAKNCLAELSQLASK